MTKAKVLLLSFMAAALVGCAPTDATINSSVQQKLAADNTVKSATIEASTQKKIVTLTGTVGSQQIKDRASAVARQADGVSDVVNQIAVAPSGEGRYGPGAAGSGPGMMNGGSGTGGMSGGGIGHGAGQGSGGSGQAGGQGSGTSQPPPQKQPE